MMHKNGFIILCEQIKGWKMIIKHIYNMFESFPIQFTYQLLNEIKLRLPGEKSGSCYCDELLFLNSALFFQTSKKKENIYLL
jgi:hypothetical protein